MEVKEEWNEAAEEDAVHVYAPELIDDCHNYLCLVHLVLVLLLCKSFYEVGKAVRVTKLPVPEDPLSLQHLHFDGHIVLFSIIREFVEESPNISNYPFDA